MTPNETIARLTNEGLRKNQEINDLKEIIRKSITQLQGQGEMIDTSINLLERSTNIMEEYLRYKRANFLIGVLAGIIALFALERIALILFL